MWEQALLITPYLAVASSLVLAIAVTVICCSQPARPRAAGFAA